MKLRIIISVFVVFLFSEAKSQVRLQNLRCELLTDPLGIDSKEPRLSWEIDYYGKNLQQTAYHIIVASTIPKLMSDEGDLWNSGKVNSSQSVQVSYAGKPLTSQANCYWKVKVFTNKGESGWSGPSNWSMGLLNKEDWKAKWIGYDKASSWDSVTQWSRLSARYLRKNFKLSSPVRRARVFVCGLGLYELYVNGKKISNDLILPAPTDYRKSVLYNTFDISDINEGDHTIGVVLGNGRYFTMRQDYKPQKINTFGFPKLLLQLEVEYMDGRKETIVSDESWKLNVDGPIRTNNEYDGEEYDATKELTGWNKNGYDDRKWLKPELVKAPDGVIRAQMIDPVKIKEHIRGSVIYSKGKGKYILDMGQNFSGFLKIKVNGKRGDRVKLRFAESLQSNGEIYVANLRDARVTDIYTLKGGGVETWQPSFVYHGFRYVEITGYPGVPSTADFEGQFLYDDMKTTGHFLSSDSILNKLVTNAFWGIASNYKGMPVDCPQRNERQPWLGDRSTGSGGEAFIFNNANLYAKWLDDIEESQTEEGAIPDVAPAFWNYYSDNMTWPGTYLLVADMLYRQFGDKRSIVKHYPSMKKWMNYMKTKYMKDYILTKDKYGDWCVPPESLELIRSSDSTRTTKGPLISTAYYYWLLQYMKRFAVLSNQAADIKEYDELGEKVKQAFHKNFFNAQKKWYDNNTVTANLLPLYFGITPDSLKDAVFKSIYTKIKLADKMHISTGVIGTQWLMRGLSRFQQPEMAFELASNKTYPSWGYMIENGATTIWELWNGNTANPQMNSQNHVMLLGDLLIWMFENLAGIKSDATETGFKKIIMKPENINGLKSVTAIYHSMHGEISSTWYRDTERSSFAWTISIPPNTSAVVYIPAKKADDVKEQDRDGIKFEEVKFLRMEDGYAVFEVPSGQYWFSAPLLKNISYDKGF